MQKCLKFYKLTPTAVVLRKILLIIEPAFKLLLKSFYFFAALLFQMNIFLTGC